ncbi:MAG TPA: hypothetical protein VFX50_04470 [Gemmatimonadales bacterium]|nr:hypothetical protein [Gemmatimonadales bacterium]
MLLALQAVQGWVGPTMAISLVVIALSFLAIAATVVLSGLAVARQARKLREQMATVEDDARRAMRSVRRAARNAAEASEVLKEQAHLFAHTGKKIRRRVDDVSLTVHQRIGELDALYEVVAEELEDTAIDVATSVRAFRGNPVMRVARSLLGGRR